MNYYNENDPKAAAWLRELIKEKLIPNGHVDTRSIRDVSANDLGGFAQCHFFAGIGGWSHALRLAGWPEGKPIWTMSCPCQPFSCAGKGLGEADDRHLWPTARELIRAGKPSVVFGEQVASAAGRLWLAGIFADLEAMGYQRAAVDLCAAGVGGPHIRQRLYWVANANGIRRDEQWKSSGPSIQRECSEREAQQPKPQCCGKLPRGFERLGPSPRRMGDTNRERPQGYGQPDRNSQEGGHNEEGYSPHPGAWGNYDIIPCQDGKSRRIESGTFPLAHGIPGRVGLLRGYGNAIVPQVAAEFIQAYQEAMNIDTAPTSERVDSPIGLEGETALATKLPTEV